MNKPTTWRLVTGLALTCTLLATFSCSWERSAGEVIWKDESRSLRQWVKASGRGYQCYFVTITGRGITPDYGPGDLGTRDPQCMGLGINSPTVSLETIENTGIPFRIPGGPARRVRVIGVGISGGDCAGQTVKQLFDRRPTFIELGVAEENTFVDKRITVRASANLANAIDLVKPCDKPDQPLPSVVTDTRLAALLSNGTLRIFKRGADLKLIKDQDYSLGGGLNATQIVAQPDFRSFYAFEPASTYFSYQRFNIDAQNNIVTGSGPGYRVQLTHGGDDLAFSSTGSAAFVRRSGGYTAYQTNALDWALLGPCNFLTTYMFSIGNYNYNVAGSQVYWLAADGNGNHCGASAGGPVNLDSSIQEARRGANGVLYVLTGNNGNLRTSAYSVASNGALTSIGPPALLSNNSIGSMAVVGAPDHLFIADQAMALILRFGFGSGGIIVPVGNPVVSGLNIPRRFRADPQGKSLFIINAVGSLLQYAVSTNGQLTQIAGDETQDDGKYADILPLPLF